MYRPTTKSEHDESLLRFIQDFNLARPLDITIRMYPEERFVHNGVIDLWEHRVKYDWEKRYNWEGEKFPFHTLGQLERKFDPKKGIELSIQSNADETHFAVAWHREFDEAVNVSRETDYQWQEKGTMRTTRKFRIFRYREIEEFKEWLLTTYRLDPSIERARNVILDARFYFEIGIELPNKSIPLSLTTPNGIPSQEATIEIHKREDNADLVNIDFSTAIGKISLTVTLTDLERILEGIKNEG